MLSYKDILYLKNFYERVVLHCEKCHGTNLNCSCFDSYFLEKEVVKAQVPRLYWKMKFEDFFGSVSEGPHKVESYVQEIDENYEQGRGLYLYGGIGTAKTALACLILMKVLSKGYNGYYTNLQKCIRMFTAGWKDEEKKEDFRTFILESDFLVLEDIVIGYGRKDFLAAELESLFQERIDNLLPTIITSNRSIDSLKSDYGARIVSLFQGHLIPVECMGIDYRKSVLADKLKNTK